MSGVNAVVRTARGRDSHMQMFQLSKTVTSSQSISLVEIPLRVWHQRSQRRKQRQKKKKRPANEGVLGLASTPVASLNRPGRVTLMSSTPLLGSGLLGSPPQASTAAFAMPAVLGGIDSTPPAATVPNPVMPGEFICEVCMRKFSSEEMLRKHEKMSDLHKQNLAKLHGDV